VAVAPEICHARLMQPKDIQQIGDELAIKWEDGSESFIALERLRKCCPCAGCKGEKDIMGNLYKNPARPLSAQAFQLVRLDRVGGYAIQPIWADGHATGLFPFDLLKRLGGQGGT
jgi:DUF971 family protein